MPSGETSTFWKVVLIILAIIILVLLFWLIKQCTSPPISYYQEGQDLTYQPLFYTGSARIESMVGSIQLEPARAPQAESLTVTFLNTGPLHEIVDITFGRPGVISSFPEDTLRSGIPTERDILVPVEFNPSIAPYDSLKETRILLSAYNFDQPFGTAAERVDVEIIPPIGVNGLVSYSIPLEVVRQGAVSRYFLNESPWTPMDLRVFHTTYGVTLCLEKNASAVPGTDPQEYLVHLKIVNLGPGTAHDISLRDDFDPHYFQGKSREFTRTRRGRNRGWIYWARILSLTLAAGDSTLTDYTVVARRDLGPFRLRGTTAYIDNHLVGVSNNIALPPPP